MLYLDGDGVWRCGGRLGNSDLPYHTKYPILLPRSHCFTLLVVRRAHQRVQHSGVKDTLTEVRSRYWIPQGRAFVREYINHCVICRRFSASHYKPPPPPPLPDFRVKRSAPFSAVGVDYAGPLTVKQTVLTSSTACLKGGRNAYTSYSVKIWVCLFTCCVTRAVHIELVTNLSSNSFLDCFKRFVSRRGLPSLIISDNGTTFQSAAKTLRGNYGASQGEEVPGWSEREMDFQCPKSPMVGRFFRAYDTNAQEVSKEAHWSSEVLLRGTFNWCC